VCERTLHFRGRRRTIGFPATFCCVSATATAMEQVSATFQNRGIDGLARAIALPHMHPPTRFPSFPALERTAVLSYNYPAQWNVPISSDEATGPIRTLLMRQPAYPLWVDTMLSQSQNYISWAVYDPMVVSAEQSDVPVPAGLAATGVGNGTGPASWLSVSNTGTDPAVGHHIMGRDEGTGAPPWHYHSGGSQTAVYIRLATQFGITGGAYLQCEYWASPGTVATTQTFASTLVDLEFLYFNIVPPASLAQRSNFWWRPVFYSHTGTTASVVNGAQVLVVTTPVGLTGSITTGNLALSASTISGTTTIRMLPFARPVDYGVSDEPWNDTRLTAVSALFTNVTKVLNKEGTVLAGRIVPTSAKYPAIAWNFTKEMLSALNPAEKSYLALEHGHYTYAPPSTDLTRFWDYTIPTSGRSTTATAYIGGATAPVVRLDNDSLVNCAVFTDADGGTSLAVNVDWHVEFRTTSQLWPLGLSAVTLESLHQAQLALVSAGFFFPNESHKKEVSTIISKIRSWAKAARPVVEMVSPAAARVLHVIETPEERQAPPPQSKKGKGSKKQGPPATPHPPPKGGKGTGGRGRPRGPPPEVPLKKGSTTPQGTSLRGK